MAPPKSRNTISKKSNFIEKFYRNYVNLKFLKYLIFEPESLPIISAGILLIELFLNIFVVQTVRYTEIDWIAYMQECEGFLNGTTNYALLRGDTGPLVYPGGFVYIYSFLYGITSKGQNIKLAQYIFIFIYLLQMYLVLRLYTKSRRVPPYVLVISAFTSYRIHSIYVLRLFNDPIAILFLYFALNLYLDQHWTLASIFYSLGVSVKMNILLFAPAIFLLYLTNLGYVGTIKQLLICGVIQLLMGAPFLLTHPIEYLKGSFDLGRIFEHKWTVNYRFLDRTIFECKQFHLALFILHLTLLIVFAKPCYKYFQNYCRLRVLEKQLQPQIDRENARIMKIKKPKKLKQQNQEKLSKSQEKLTKNQEEFLSSFEKGLQKSTGLNRPATNLTQINDDVATKPEKLSIHFDKSTQLALLPLFLSNFIGIICARSLHYQFYVWYFHSLPYLTWYTDYSLGLKFLILGLIELAWNTYPSTTFSSIILHCCHVVLLFGISRKLYTKKVETEKTE